MKIDTLSLEGPRLITPDKKYDSRGFFARTFCQEQLNDAGIRFSVVQSSLSFNEHLHTLRGMHYQIEPACESKIVSCLQGAIYDVVVDLRGASPTWGQWLAVRLDQDTRASLYIPPGFGHGFLTLTPGCLVSYSMDAPHAPEFARGVRWNDPDLAISWPHPPAHIHPRDSQYPDVNPSAL